MNSTTPDCRYTSPDGRLFDLTSWANRTVVATGRAVSFNVSLCGNLPTICHDSLTGTPLPPGAVFSLFEHQPAGTCWDVLAHWSDRQAPTFGDDGLVLHFSHPFDAHLGCLDTNVTVHVNVTCDSQAHEPIATGSQIRGCEWVIGVQTADPGVCSRPHAAAPLPPVRYSNVVPCPQKAASGTSSSAMSRSSARLPMGEYRFSSLRCDASGQRPLRTSFFRCNCATANFSARASSSATTACR